MNKLIMKLCNRQFLGLIVSAKPKKLSKAKDAVLLSILKNRPRDALWMTLFRLMHGKICKKRRRIIVLAIWSHVNNRIKSRSFKNTSKMTWPKRSEIRMNSWRSNKSWVRFRIEGSKQSKNRMKRLIGTFLWVSVGHSKTMPPQQGLKPLWANSKNLKLHLLRKFLKNFKLPKIQMKLRKRTIFIAATV